MPSADAWFDEVALNDFGQSGPWNLMLLAGSSS